MDILGGLNPAQREAVEAISGPVLILAGPGSGKTRVITHRVAYLIRTCGVSPHSIMAVTFTNKAAREMEDRLRTLVSGSVESLTLGTFHAICARILRREGSEIGIEPRFVIYDDDDQLSMVKRSLEDSNVDPKQYAPRAMLSAISAAKSATLTPAEYQQHAGSYFEEVVGRVYQRYQELLSQSNALDFDDLLMKVVLLFRSKPDVLSRYQSRYLHIMVDEFQDTNLVQYELVKLLAGKCRNLCVVGDPDQSIYSWRSADLRNILNFEKDFPDARVVLLEQNYRSTQKILETASCVIAANRQRKPKRLWTENDAGDPVAVVETYTEQEEAQFVVGEVDQLVSQGKARPGDCAVMFRTNAQSRALEEAFIRYGTPYRLVAGTRFYERREVKDVIAYLRLIQNPRDSVSLMRVVNVPGRGIGQQTMARLSSQARSLGVSELEAMRLLGEEGRSAGYAPRMARALVDFARMIDGLAAQSRELPVVELFDLALEKAGYEKYVKTGDDGEERWDNVQELRTVAQQHNDLPPPEGLTALLEGVALVSDVDGLEQGADAVTLITLHQAKGLEFPVVFMVGMEDGILPHFRSFDDPSQMEEERRLCYVGITRAKKSVYLVRAYRRGLMGRNMVGQPSRFLEDIPGHLVKSNALWQKEDSRPPVAPWEGFQATASVDVPELKAGDHVRHARFGDGVVVSCQQVKDDTEAVIAFRGSGVKKLSLSFARIEKVG